MTEDEMRDALAEQVWGVLVAAGLRDETRGPSPSVIAHAAVRNLLPVVRGIVAEELRWAATETECRRDLDMLKRRADALDGAA